MSDVLSFVGYRPSARFDAHPWTTITVQGSTSTSAGPWADVAGPLTISPQDTDPTEPAARNVTVQGGDDSFQWYRIVFGDAFDGTEATEAVPASSRTQPTASDIRALAVGFDFGAFGYPAPASGDPDPLEGAVEAAVAWVEAMTGRTLDSTLPDRLRPIATDAVFLRLQLTVASRTTQTIITGNDGIQSFTAGDYSETRFDRSKQVTSGSIFVPDDLMRLLLLLATPERYAELLMLMGAPAPPVGLTVSPPGSEWWDDVPLRYGEDPLGRWW